MEELELTFLPKNFPTDLKDLPFKKMVDIYLPVKSVHPSLRVRLSGEKCEITKKQPIVEGDASHQLETTIPLTMDEYEDLEKIEGKRVVKNRYIYKTNGLNYEIDVFLKDLEGLVLVDVEFSSLEEKKSFVAPEWLLKEVTQETFLAGGMLCGKKYEDIKDRLDSFGYKPL